MHRINLSRTRRCRPRLVMPAAMDVAESERSEFEDVESAVRHEGMDEEMFASVDELQNHGIGAADIQKLRAAGICSVKVENPC